MQKSIYLARLIGPVLLAIGLAALLNAPAFRVMAGQFLHNYAIIFLSGVLTLTAGIAIVLIHNVWEADWRAIITVFGWLGVIGGAARIILPQKVAIIGASVIAHGIAPMFGGFAMLVAGGVLAYFGYAEFFEAKPARKKRRRR